MRRYDESGEDVGREGTIFLLGIAGGVVIGLLLARRLSDTESVTTGIDPRPRGWAIAGRRFPARFHRRHEERRELILLEDDVLDAFLTDPVLGRRGIDVGAISPGIIELSGSVSTAEEAEHAVRLASDQAGVSTVVNRLEIDDDLSSREMQADTGQDYRRDR